MHTRVPKTGLACIAVAQWAKETRQGPMGRRFSKALDVSLEEQDDDSTVVSLHNDGAHVFACRPLHWHSAALAREDSSRLSLYNFFPPSLMREGLNMNLSNWSH